MLGINGKRGENICADLLTVPFVFFTRSSLRAREEPVRRVVDEGWEGARKG